MSPKPEPPGKVRIIAGSLRNSKLAVPDLPGLRPTTDRVRETVFNWLAPTLVGSRCLDLFAGTGALGIEAASRGAAEVVLVEREPRLVQALRDNLMRLRVAHASVAPESAERFLARDPAPFDVVFVDPPFDAGLWNVVAADLERGGWLAPGASIYVESPRDVGLKLPASWQLHREGHTGGVRFALYRKLREEQPAGPES